MWQVFGQAFKADHYGLIVKRYHSFAFVNNVQWLDIPHPFGVSSSLLKVIVLVAMTCATICSRPFMAILSGTWDSCKIFNNESRCLPDNNKRDEMDIWAGCFFSYLMIEYSLLLRVLVNFAVSSSLTLYFLCCLQPVPLSLFCFFPPPLLDSSFGKHVGSWLLLRFLGLLGSSLPLRIFSDTSQTLGEGVQVRRGWTTNHKRVSGRIVYWCNQRSAIFLKWIPDWSS